ncbi:IS200/IS605 family transposase [Rubritalea marina]|uniref:IS200/IS605 family transposase n=1 Tax=Rubritalea marina TaxID=361055 RepID=UPI0003769DF4|nr:IS200/IS605 family transposase [Rubritalea marina]
MPQSLSHNLLHVIFSTKERRPWICSEHREALHAYLAQSVRHHDCECYRVGGVDDHVHIAVRLSRTLAVSDLIRELKSSSSKWFKSQSNSLKQFQWQRGYGAFSLSPKDLDALLRYIDKQEEHHRQQSFQDEYRKILRKYGIEWDEKYVWD